MTVSDAAFGGTSSSRDLPRRVPKRPVPAQSATSSDGLRAVEDEVVLLGRAHPCDQGFATSTQRDADVRPTADALASPPSVIRLAEPHPAEYTFELLQQWEGVVQAVGIDDFDVVLRDLTDPSHPEEEAVIGLEEVSPDDLPLLRVGAVLYWSIGYERLRSGQVKRVSMIRLRRLPAWSKRDVERINQKAEALMGAFGATSDAQRSSRAG